MAEERLQKLMAQAGLGSRRACETMIEQGRVTVNGKPVALGNKADPDTDDIRVDGERINPKGVETVFFVINKPPNVLSAPVQGTDDKRQTVFDIVNYDGHLFTIGRLDAESEGMIVLTNDGDTANKLAHPRYEHTKTYKVTVYGEPSETTLEEWQNGVYIGPGEKTAPCFVKVLESNTQTSVLRIVMTEGKKRQIRRVATMLGHPVKKLMRTHIGQLGIGTLRRGEWYQLGEEELKWMREPAWELETIRKRRRALRQQDKNKRRFSRPQS